MEISTECIPSQFEMDGGHLTVGYGTGLIWKKVDCSLLNQISNYSITGICFRSELLRRLQFFRAISCGTTELFLTLYWLYMKLVIYAS